MRTLFLIIIILVSSAACGGDGEKADLQDKDQTKTDQIQNDLASDAAETFADSKDGADLIKLDVSPELKQDTEKLDTFDAGECSPDCYNKVCGDNGCGGTCGKCPKNTMCSKDQSKCIPEAVQKEFGEICGLTETCRPYLTDPETGEEIKNEEWPSCADDQCADGVCFGAYLPLLPFCSRPCAIYKDDINNVTLEKTPDGIEDLDATDSDCTGASANSPLGTEFHCIRYFNETESDTSFCYPGHDFKPCGSDSDCPAGEGCHMIQIYGEFEFRCLINMPDSVEVTSECNDDPMEGNMAYCSTSLCFGVGCVGVCTDDSQCLTASKDKGCDTSKNTCFDDPAVSCDKDSDCSAWLCEKKFDFFGDESLFVDLCFPRICQMNNDCKDSDFYCRPYINSEEDPEKIAWEPRCLHKIKNGAKLGEECNDDPEDTIPDKPCEDEFWCWSDQCLGMCMEDSDCAVDKSQKCSVVEYGIDADDPPDDKYDTILPLGVCWYLPGSQTPCVLNKDCTDVSEACMSYEKDFIENSEKKYKMLSTCTKMPEKSGKWGDLCGADTGVECYNNICLGDDPAQNQAGYCTQMCTSKNDCPDVTIGENSYKSVCRSYLFAWGGTLNDYSDDMYIPLCILVSNEDSLANCEETKICTKQDETCVFWTIATNPDAPAKAEYTCISNLDENGNPPPDKFGAECTMESETVECENIYCEQDVKKGKGYCSKLCNEDNDCSGLEKGFCDEVRIIDRKNDDYDLKVKICHKKLACIPCTADSECPGEFVCINAGGSGMLADYRCAPPCEIDDNCTGAGGGALCIESKDKNGNPEAKKACIPDKCQ
jgi:hypothetical protein